MPGHSAEQAPTSAHLTQSCLWVCLCERRGCLEKACCLASQSELVPKAKIIIIPWHCIASKSGTSADFEVIVLLVLLFASRKTDLHYAAAAVPVGDGTSELVLQACDVFKSGLQPGPIIYLNMIILLCNVDPCWFSKKTLCECIFFQLNTQDYTKESYIISTTRSHN